MMKYEYSVYLKNQELKTTSMPKLAKMINDAFEFPVVTTHTLNNYFTRREKMESKAKLYDSFGLQRTIIG